jgi:hypothetical protein
MADKNDTPWGTIIISMVGGAVLGIGGTLVVQMLMEEPKPAAPAGQLRAAT